MKFHICPLNTRRIREIERSRVRHFYSNSYITSFPHLIKPILDSRCQSMYEWETSQSFLLSWYRCTKNRIYSKKFLSRFYRVDSLLFLISDILQSNTLNNQQKLCFWWKIFWSKLILESTYFEWIFPAANFDNSTSKILILFFSKSDLVIDQPTLNLTRHSSPHHVNYDKMVKIGKTWIFLISKNFRKIHFGPNKLKNLEFYW